MLTTLIIIIFLWLLAGIISDSFIRKHELLDQSSLTTIIKGAFSAYQVTIWKLINSPKQTTVVEENINDEAHGLTDDETTDDENDINIEEEIVDEDLTDNLLTPENFDSDDLEEINISNQELDENDVVNQELADDIDESIQGLEADSNVEPVEETNGYQQEPGPVFVPPNSSLVGREESVSPDDSIIPTIVPISVLEETPALPESSDSLLELNLDAEIEPFDQLPKRPRKHRKVKTVCPTCRRKTKHDRNAICLDCLTYNKWLMKRWGLTIEDDDQDVVTADKDIYKPQIEILDIKEAEQLAEADKVCYNCGHTKLVDIYGKCMFCGTVLEGDEND